MVGNIDQKGGGIAAVVMAAGRGERLKPLTDVTPKCLVEVGGIPVLDRWQIKLMEAGVHDVFINAHHLPAQIVSRIDHYNENFDCTWTVLYEEELLGTARTLYDFLRRYGGYDRLIVIYADNASDVNLAETIRLHMSSMDKLPFTLALFRAEEPKSCGIAIVDDEHVVVSFEEKPSCPQGNLAFAGILVAETEPLRQYISSGDADLSADVIQKLCGLMRGLELLCYHKDYGTLARLRRVKEDFGAKNWGAP